MSDYQADAAEGVARWVKQKELSGTDMGQVKQEASEEPSTVKR
jgi:hypothetical protein